MWNTFAAVALAASSSAEAAATSTTVKALIHHHRRTMVVDLVRQIEIFNVGLKIYFKKCLLAF